MNANNIIDISHNDISNNKVIEPAKPECIYKVLNHCGCSIVGLLENKKLINITYPYICDFCFLAMSKDDYNYILEFFWDDMRYSLKELINYKGWIDSKSWYSAMYRLKHSKTKMYTNANQFVKNFVLPFEETT